MKINFISASDLHGENDSAAQHQDDIVEEAVEPDQIKNSDMNATELITKKFIE